MFCPHCGGEAEASYNGNDSFRLDCHHGHSYIVDPIEEDKE